MAFAIIRKSSQLRQVLISTHEKVLSSNISKIDTFIGSAEVKRPHSWLFPLSRYHLMQHMSTQSESLSSEPKHADERRRLLNRILYRSRQRGHLELDLILGKWTEENVEKLDDKKLKSLVEVLDLENPELWKWLTGQEVTPQHLTQNPVFMDIHERIMGALKTHSPSETRAKLGQPWVRGWDDNRKIGGPQAGNQ
eukprot:c19168_g3_i1 orf=424-1008(-)